MDFDFCVVMSAERARPRASRISCGPFPTLISFWILKICYFGFLLRFLAGFCAGNLLVFRVLFNLKIMTNKEIHHRFRGLGREHRAIINQLVAMLPEIDKREIYREHGCASIYEYAGKYGGLSYSVVQKALWVEEKLTDAPKLKEAIKTEGIHKVALFATLATKENDEALADKVRNMSKPALQELSKELRGNIVKKVSVELDSEMQFLLNKLKRELGIEDDLEALKIILRKFRNPIPGDEKIPRKKASQEPQAGAESRYIPAQQKREAIQKTNGKCAYPNCSKPYEHLHHSDYFAHSRDHQNLQPLCRSHHEFMHNGLVGFSGQEPKEWKLILDSKTNYYDSAYRKARKII